MNLQDLIDQLLFEEEGTTLDFKREQYRFRGATDEEKSELLKDILSFANAHRRTDAYILIGVQEVKGGRSEVVGISDDLDDANLQQFINSKTNRPIDFSYKATQYNNLKVGIIHIPVQRRPFYLTKDVGKLQKDRVYIRRSSSTDIASPDEILSSMGREDISNYKEIPSLDVFLVSGKHDEIVEKQINCKLINAQIPTDNDFPFYGRFNPISGTTMQVLLPDYNTNHDYYREWAKYLQALSRVDRFKISVKNSASIAAKDVKVVFDIVDEERILIVREMYEPPHEPFTTKVAKGTFYREMLNKRRNKVPDISVKSTSKGWCVTFNLGKIQPQDMVNTVDYFYFGSLTSKSVQIFTQIFSDDLPEPKEEMLEIKFEVEDRVYSVDEIVNEANLNLHRS